MKSSIALALAASLLLASCAGLPHTSDSPPLPTGNATVDQINVVVQQVRDGAAKYCGLVPTVETASSIIATFTGGMPIVALVGTAVEGFCKAATSKGARRGHRPTYRGVVLHYTKA